MILKFRERDIRKGKKIGKKAEARPVFDKPQKRISKKISGRVNRLKKLWEEVSEESSLGKTIRLPDKKSATSLSLLFPGIGQVYMGQSLIGAAFIFSNVALIGIYLFLSGILRITTFSSSLIPSYDFHILLIAPLAISMLSGISIHMAFGLFPELKLTQLITANRKREYYYLSFIFPGYGQLLNAQPKKGIFFSSTAILGIFAYLGIYFTYFINWYEFTEELGVKYVEVALIVMTVIAALSTLFYLISVFDAFVVRKYPYIKRPFLKRYFQSIGFKSPTDKAPFRRSSLKFSLVSAVCIFILLLQISRPSYRIYYADKVNSARSTFQNKGMILIPSILDNLKYPESLKRLEKTFNVIS